MPKSGDIVRALFVGGPWDGRREDVRHSERIIVPVLDGPAVSHAPLAALLFKQVVYRPMLFGGRAQQFCIYAEESLSADDVMGMLVVHNYQSDWEYVALLAGVLAEPAEDAPRLVLADFLQEQGEEARAEFIRVQCELANPQEILIPFDETGMYLDLSRTTGTTQERACWLRARERELIDQCGYGWCDGLLGADWKTQGHAKGPNPRAVVTFRHRDNLECTSSFTFDFVRGFVAELTCTAADFLAHGDAITATHPIERVAITRLTFGTYDDLRIPGGRWDVRDRADTEAYLKGMWPGITFTVRPAE